MLTTKLKAYPDKRMRRLHKILPPKGQRKEKDNPDCIPKTDQGSIVWKHEEMESAVFQYFTRALGTRVDKNCTFDWERLDLSKTDDPTLDAQFSLAELTTLLGICRQRRLLAWIISLDLSIRFVGLSSGLISLL